MKKDILIIGFIALILVLLCSGINIQSVEDYYLTHLDDITPDSETVTVSIECKTILNNYDKLEEHLKNETYVPADGIISESQKYALRDGDTAISMLKRITRYNKIHLEFSGGYVEGINYIYQFSCGDLSGWMLKINGNLTSVGSGNTILKDGDSVLWVYSCSLGLDI